MKTVIYLIRHSEPMKKKIDLINNDSLQITNEKNPLSIIGEQKALALSKIDELKDIDLVISSNYVRAMSTAKYIAENNNKDLYLNENFGERKFGVSDWSQKPQGFEKRQLVDLDYKIGDGESHNEVAERMYDSLMKTVNENIGKRIVIVSHATAILFLLMKFGTYSDNKLYFNGKVLIDENFKWNAPEVFKLEFEDNELIAIKNIR